MSFFGGSNPFATKVGALIEQATDGSQASENWGAFMAICDLINETEEGPKDAIKAIKKKMTSNTGKNFTVVMYTLTLLETCVKNCGKRFHIFVANKDFLQDMVKIMGPKNDPPQIVQEKVLSLIQTWADAFQGIPELKEFGRIYQDLKHKGIEFPMTDLDRMAPIHTPARSMPEPEPRTPQRTTQTRPVDTGSTMTPPRVMTPDMTTPASGPVLLSPEQLAKLRAELDTVQQNCKVLSQMLTEMNTPDEDQADLELLQELNGTCRQMQRRLVDLVDRVQNEEVTEELLHINDDLNNVFLRYDRYQRLCANTAPPQQTVPSSTLPPPQYSAATTGGPVPAIPPPGHPTALPPPVGSSGRQPVGVPPEPNIGNLIDFDEPSPHAKPGGAGDLPADLGAVTLEDVQPVVNSSEPPVNHAPAGDDEFDMFAQSRQSFEQNKQKLPGGGGYAEQSGEQFAGGLGGAVSAKTSNTPQQPEKEVVTEYDEMAQWLSDNKTSTGQESATSSEFDQFLASRVKEVEQMPDVTSPPQNTTNVPRSGRQMQKEDPDSALFSL